MKTLKKKELHTLNYDVVHLKLRYYMSIISQKNFNKRTFHTVSARKLEPLPTYEGSITLITKPEKRIHHKKQNYRPKTLMNLDKNLQPNFSSSYPTIYKKVIYHNQVGFILGM